MAMSDQCKTISPSKINSAQQCPMKFYWRYIERVPSFKGWRLHAGACVDSSVNHGYKEKAKTGVLEPLTVMEDVLNMEWKNNKEEVSFFEYKPDDIFGMCRKICSEFHKEVMPDVTPKIGDDGEPMVQRKVEQYIPILDTNMIGYIDLVDVDDVIIDNKTAYGKRWKNQGSSLKRQGTSYIAMMEQKDGKLRRFRVDAVSALKTKTTVDRTNFIYSKEQVDAAVHDTRSVLQYIDYATMLYKDTGDRSLFYCNTDSWLCCHRYCSFAKMCEINFKIIVKP